MPKSGDSQSVAQFFKNQETKQEDSDTYFVYRELWKFPKIGDDERSKFIESNNKHKEWLEYQVYNHFKVGYPNRFIDEADERRRQEEALEKRSLITRQTEHFHPELIQNMISFYSVISDNLKRDTQDEEERVQIRIDQITFENEIRSRPKPDPYSEDKDANIQKIKLILLNSEDWKRKRYEQQVVRSIANKFVNKYFDTLGGLQFCRENPSEHFIKPKVDKELLLELQELGERLIKEKKESDQASQLQYTAEINQKAARDIQFHGNTDQANDNNPYSQGQGKRPFRIKNVSTMSVFKQMEKERVLQEDRDRQKNLECLEKMKKEYDIYGKQRKPLEPIFTMFKGVPEFEFNDKTITVEAPTDKRVKISSTANRAYLLAPSIDEVRNIGTHETLMRTLDKGNTVKDIEMRGKLMPVSKKENRERDFIIYPHQIDFGDVRPGNCYKAEIVLINDNYFLQRVKILPPADSNIKATLSKTGPIAMGQERRITVFLDTERLEEGEVDTELFIMSKYRKYSIPIKAKLGPNVDEIKPITLYKGKREPSGNLKKIISIETKSPYNLGGRPSDESQQKRVLPAGFNEVHKKYLTLFDVQEVNRQEMDQIKTKASGDGTGTLTQEYLQKVPFDRDHEIKPDVLKPKKPVKYDSEDEDDLDEKHSSFK